MPSAVVNSFAPEYAEREGLKVEEARAKLENLWNEAKKIAKKRDDFEEENDQFWSYVMGIWKRMVGYKKGNTSESSADHMVQIAIDLS